MNGIPNKINKNNILSKREREVKQTDTLHVPCHIIIFPERKTTTEKARLGSIFIQKLKPLLLLNYKHLPLYIIIVMKESVRKETSALGPFIICMNYVFITVIIVF